LQIINADIGLWQVASGEKMIVVISPPQLGAALTLRFQTRHGCKEDLSYSSPKGLYTAPFDPN
jgi:hypothetical protein